MVLIDCGWITTVELMPNLAGIPTGINSMCEKSTVKCVLSETSQTNGHPKKFKVKQILNFRLNFVNLMLIKF